MQHNYHAFFDPPSSIPPMFGDYFPWLASYIKISGIIHDRAQESRVLSRKFLFGWGEPIISKNYNGRARSKHEDFAKRARTRANFISKCTFEFWPIILTSREKVLMHWGKKLFIHKNFLGGQKLERLGGLHEYSHSIAMMTHWTMRVKIYSRGVSWKKILYSITAPITSCKAFQNGSRIEVSSAKYSPQTAIC